MENARHTKIRLEGISKTFVTEEGQELTALQDVTTEIYDRELVCVIGPSGCGKTTLLNIVAGLLSPTRGKVLLDGKEVAGPGPDRGVVFQRDAIFPWRNVLDNVTYGLELKKIPKEERQRIGREYLSLVNLEAYENLYPKELSGGMRKRVAIATVLANDPEILLMDEPFGALDYPTKCSLQEELLNIWKSKTKTTLFVTHDVEEALFLADRVFVFVKGRLERIVDVLFPRPRLGELRVEADFNQAKKQLWEYMIPSRS